MIEQNSFEVNPEDREEFSTLVFFCDGSRCYEVRLVPLRVAWRVAYGITGTVGARSGVVQRVIIIDGRGTVCFEWTHQDGTIFLEGR